MFFKLQILYYLLRIKFRMQFFSKKSLQRIKWRRKRKSLTKSKYYLNFVNKAELEAFPIMNKQFFMANFNVINTAGITLDQALKVAQDAETSRDFSSEINKVTVGLSSGTSGNQGVFLASESERAQWVATIIDRVLGFSLKKRNVAFFLRANSNLYESVKSRLIQFNFFDLLEPLPKHVDRLNSLKPNILVAQPSMLLLLAKEVSEGRLKFNPQKIISVAEVLYPEDRIKLESIFNQTIHQVYQCTEGFLAATCKAGVLHFNEDFLIIEKKYIDDEKKRFHPIITDLERSTQPVIRYELNDIIHEKTQCSCGSNWMAIESIEGRSDDILTFTSAQGESVKIFPDFFRRTIIGASPKITDYALICTGPITLELYIPTDEDTYKKAKVAIQALLQSRAITDVTIKRISHHKTKQTDKLRRIKNEN